MICKRYRTLFGVIHFISFRCKKKRCCCRRFVLLLEQEKVTSLLSRILVPTQQAETFFHNVSICFNFFKLRVIYISNSCMILFWLQRFVYIILVINDDILYISRLSSSSSNITLYIKLDQSIPIHDPI